MSAYSEHLKSQWGRSATCARRLRLLARRVREVGGCVGWSCSVCPWRTEEYEPEIDGPVPACGRVILLHLADALDPM
jgi:hypothetical protein